MWEISVGISKLPKYATRESGDTVEVIERPGGGLSIVIADAQGTGRAAKLLSNLVTSRAVGLIKDGARDTAVHEAVHDHLYHYRGGRVSCTLTTITIDTRKRICTLTRNSGTPAYFLHDARVEHVGEESLPLGIAEDLAPVSASVHLRPGVWVVATTDGVERAGLRSGHRLSVEGCLRRLVREDLSPSNLADHLLTAAIERDAGRPADDMTVAVVGVVPASAADDRRRMTVSFPLSKESVRDEADARD